MRSVPGWGVITATSAPVLLIGGWTLAAGWRPDRFDSVKDTISALAAQGAPNRWVMTAALVGVGAAHVGTAAALRPAAPAARWLLATGGLATVLVAANPLPPDDGPAPVHAAVAGVAFVALGVWPAVSWRRRPALPERRAPGDRAPGNEAPGNRAPGDEAQPLPFRPVPAAGAAAALLTALGWFFVELAHHSDRVGLSERVAAGSQALWPLAAVLLARRGQPARRPS